MSDMLYTKDGMFTRFVPDAKAGEDAWRQMWEQSGSNAVFNHEAAAVIATLRQAGYSVSKAKKPTIRVSDDQLLAELGV